MKIGKVLNTPELKLSVLRTPQNKISLNLYNNNYIYKIKLTNNIHLCNKNCIINESKILYINLIQNIIDKFKKIKFKKIKFEGKGYYLYKNFRNTIAPKFGFAHRLYNYNYNIWIKVLSKTKLLFFNYNKEDLNNVSHSLRLLRPRNVFTGRGVRFARSERLKKRGKVSSFR